jgi:predicted enzyme related to lactoylglutathione lyase
VSGRTRYEPGVFCAVGLAASDRAAATAFYTELFGWEAEDRGAYTSLRRDGAEVAVLYLQTDEARAEQVTPHWTSYISVVDADATAERARELGATQLRETFDVGAVGRIATLRDPVGAIVSLWQPGSSAGAELVNDPGAWCWNELSTTDVERARSFYGDLLGWEFETSPSGYATIVCAGGRNGGIRPQSERELGNPASWIPYFTVESADETCRAAEGLGAGALLPATAFGDERIGVLADPQGAVFVVFQGDTDP